MVTTNFTVTGEYVECIARLDNGTPAFDLFVNGEEIARGIGYKTLLEMCETVRSEMGQLATYWQDAGRKVFEFNETWRKHTEEVKQDD